MVTRLSRSETVDRNRELVLAAAREVFTERGYHEATLDQIAARAGFSKGVVYSQFASKADLFLALLERRIALRAEQNRAAVRTLVDKRSRFDKLIDLVASTEEADPAWSLVVIEFRLHACRHPDLATRYVELHRRTAAELAGTLEEAYQRAGLQPPVAVGEVAAAVIVLGMGFTVETALGSGLISPPSARRLARTLMGDSTPSRSSR